MTDHPKHALPVGHAIGGYAIVRVIGQGGFGIVYEAYNSDTEQRVAIKEYYPSSIASRQDGTIVLNSERERDVFDKVLARYRSTALLQLKFDHPNILKIYDYIRAKNTGYMVTEFIDGEPMRAVLNRHGGRVPSYDIFRKMFEPMISALAYIHSRGYLHRDIAPDNIMWTKDGRPVLIDFGALKEDVGQDSRISSLVVVKEDYSPPEQQVPDKKRPMGFYTDIFALAGTMYAALAGHPPARAMARALNTGCRSLFTDGRSLPRQGARRDLRRDRSRFVSRYYQAPERSGGIHEAAGMGRKGVAGRISGKTCAGNERAEPL
ncbi:MAG: serine/threonine protein kinase [Xanthobacteraceae bacterium]|nr:serine/threonine protein kinase [Xanthobacteraceae bacterium]QYK44331.1 MAG: serine/threonine protein kinase [Xanthobacteraceae bacterium]